MLKSWDFVRQRNLPHSPMTDRLPSTSFKESHSSEQAFADSPGELTTSRKLGWQQTLAEEPRQLFSHYSITSWQAGCITPIGIAPSTGRPGDHRETAGSLTTWTSPRISNVTWSGLRILSLEAPQPPACCITENLSLSWAQTILRYK